MLKIKYNFELLNSLCDNIYLDKDYSKIKLNRDTYITGKCVTEGCTNLFNRTFRYIYNSNNFCCELCTKNAAKVKSKDTCMIKYGVHNPMLLQETKNKIKNTLINKYGENDILFGAKNVPNIWYLDETNKKHKHYVVFFIKSQNKCVEVKSTWTFKKKTDNVILKQIAAKTLGYNYEIWIYNNKGEKLETIF